MNLHFIGIGGVGMSGLAAICLQNGDRITGSDNIENQTIDNLKNSGATIFKGHSSENVLNDTDLVVYTSAVPHNNPELVHANDNGIKIMNRAVFLGQLMDKYKNKIAVSGTHGKTSTTSMISTILVKANMDPTISVGGQLDYIGGNYRVGNGDYFITEACEYVDSFLCLNPTIAVINNVELEHIDYFKNLDHVISSFRKFAENVSENGKIIANGDDENVRKSLDGLQNVVYFGFDEKNDCVISNISQNGIGNTFSLSLDGQNLGEFSINVLGNFNILNAVAAILTSYNSNISLDIIKDAISTYNGVGRRFEKKGNYKNSLVFDDYAHHPSEVKATLMAASKLDKNRLITIFQPHTFSRTLQLMDEFEKSFDDTDILILADIYPSRERDTGIVHSKDLFEKLKDRAIDVKYLGTQDEIYEYIKSNAMPDDIVLTMGAGDIFKLANRLVDEK